MTLVNERRATSIMKKLIASIFLLCFITVTFSPIISAAFIQCNCGCVCGDNCKCGDNCECAIDCECEESPCFVCDAIVKKRGIQEQSATVAPVFNIDVNQPSEISSTVKSNILRICTASIVDDNIRMNN